MAEHQGFLRTILEDPEDDTHRLIYADWLEEHGDCDRAEFIRVQCELEPIRDRYEIPRAAELHQREEALVRAHNETWLGKLPGEWSHSETGSSQ